MWHIVRGRELHTGFLGKPERKRLLGRPGRRWAMFKKECGRTWIYVVMSSNRWRVVVDRVMKL
jgi:hypothetical protein